MTQGQNVIYLPPGVAAAPTPPPPVGPPGIPFAKAFFQGILPVAIKNFCAQADCDAPIVELLTTDGLRHFVKGISGVADQWVALHTEQEDHEHPIQVFIPYLTIVRVEIHPEKDQHQRRLGFIASLEDYGDDESPVIDVEAEFEKNSK